MQYSKPPGECVLTDTIELSAMNPAPVGDRPLLPRPVEASAAGDRARRKAAGLARPAAFGKEPVYFTVSVTALLVTLPASLETMQRYFRPLKPAVTVKLMDDLL